MDTSRLTSRLIKVESVSAEEYRKLIDLYATLYSFPREVGLPRKIVNSLPDFLSFIASTNGDGNVYVSVYQYKSYDENPVIDRIFMDFDAPTHELLKEVYDEVRSFVSFLKSRNLSPLVVFSGKKGFHVYLFLKPVTLKNPRESIRKLVEALVKAYKLNTQREIRFLDWKVVGDIHRLARVPYTIHPESGLLSIVVPDIEKFTLEEILENAKKLKVIDSITINPSEDLSFLLRYFDEIVEVERQRVLEESEKKEKGQESKKIIYLQLPCV
jgi:hypothetical protein